MASGAASVHEVVGNEPEAPHFEQPMTVPSLEVHPAVNNKACYRCRVVGKAGSATGRAKSLWYCTDCKNLDARIDRLTTGTMAAQMWRNLPAEEQISFRAEKATLQAEALKLSLSVTLSQRTVNEEESEAGWTGGFYPLSYYKNQGYDDKFVKHIKDTCSLRMEGAIPTYNYRVHTESWKRRQKEIMESMWKPIEPEKSDNEERGRPRRRLHQVARAAPGFFGRFAQKKKQEKEKKKEKQKAAKRPFGFFVFCFLFY